MAAKSVVLGVGTVEVQEQVAAFVLDHSEIGELDLNPVLMGSEDAKVLDATVILERP